MYALLPGRRCTGKKQDSKKKIEISHTANIKVLLLQEGLLNKNITR
jgi:hypothetical protein